ncbi:hypothetical protein GCM10022393_01770 [Aquimarina addita]|uniref:Arsenate reductase, glutaredoxin family n=1 Tax=Aquimarina addita TaxID=870485 RepID=A0ABP7X812_9FLAO
MGVISTDKNKITLIYNSETSLGKQTNAYIQASENDILTLDTAKTKITGTQWIEILEGLAVKIEDIIDKEHPNFSSEYSTDVQLDTHDWLKILDKSPEVLAYSILIKGNKFHLLRDPSDFIRYMEPDSKGVSRNPSEKE